MKKHTRYLAPALAALTMLAVPSAAMAQSDVTVAPTDRQVDQSVDRATDRHPVDLLKRRALAAIERRLDRLARLESAVTTNRHVEDDHEAQLLSEYGRAAEGLKGLAAEIEAAQTVEELRVLIPKIAEDYRIYLVVTPKSALTIASDVAEDAVAKGNEVAVKLGEAIERAEEAGYDVEDAKEALDEMRRALGRADELASPVAETVLPLQAADWPDPARATLGAAHEDMVEAHAAFRQAREAAHEVVRALRDAIGGDSDV